MSRLTRLTLIAPLCLTLAGCSFGPRLQGVAVNHNEMVANAANQVTLLNILRAREREPLHFTSISKLNGSATAVGKGTGNVSARGPTPTRKMTPMAGLTETSTVAGTEVVTPGLEASVTASSSFDVGVFDTQEFYQGIITSVPSGIVAHYLHQGWPDDLLSMLLISSVDVVATKDMTLKDGQAVKRGQAVLSIPNDADASGPAEGIKTFMQCYGLVPYTRETTPARKVIQVGGAKLDVAGLAVLDGDKYDVEEPVAPSPGEKAPDPNERWISRKAKTADGLAIMRRPLPTEKAGSLAPPSRESCEKLFDVSGKVDRSSSLPAEIRLGALLDKSGDDRSLIGSVTFPAASKKPEEDVVFEIQLVIRSVDAVVYYVGECLRTDSWQCQPARGREAVFVVKKDKPSDVFTSVKYRGATYYVPAWGDGGGRSSQVIDLIQQLVNLQKNSKDRPSTATVRVVQ